MDQGRWKQARYPSPRGFASMSVVSVAIEEDKANTMSNMQQEQEQRTHRRRYVQKDTDDMEERARKAKAVLAATCTAAHTMSACPPQIGPLCHHVFSSHIRVRALHSYQGALSACPNRVHTSSQCYIARSVSAWCRHTRRGPLPPPQRTRADKAEGFAKVANLIQPSTSERLALSCATRSRQRVLGPKGPKPTCSTMQAGSFVLTLFYTCVF